MLDQVRRALGYKFPRLGPVGFRLFSALCPKRVDSEIVPGIRTTLDLTDEMQRVVYWQGGRYEQETFGELARFCSDAEVFFDIGANCGFASYSMLAKCPRLRVYSFEPNPALFNSLRATKDRNALGRFVPVHAGLGSESGPRELHVGSANSGHSTFGPHPGLTGTGRDGQAVVVPVLTFDQWRRGEKLPLPSKPTWVAKIDVEGYEPDVLQGMAEALANRSFRALCIESNRFTLSFCGRAPQDIYDFMASVGYQPHGEHTTPNAAERKLCGQNAFFVPR